MALKKVGPGMYLPDDCQLELDIPELLRHFGYVDTEENRDTCLRGGPERRQAGLSRRAALRHDGGSADATTSEEGLTNGPRYLLGVRQAVRLGRQHDRSAPMPKVRTPAITG
jgi:hypothetical protein